MELPFPDRRILDGGGTGNGFGGKRFDIQMAEQVIEIARQEGTNFRRVDLRLEEGGAIVLEGQDMGPIVEEVWGDSDYEFWVRVEPASLSKLAYELLREKFAGRLYVNAFRFWVRARPVSSSKLAFRLIRAKFAGQLDAVDA